MGKQGPCYHCGITTTPLWRNGPPDKPVLCNACGSRWRTKGTLENYMPMHAGGFGSGSDASAETKWPRAKKGFTRPLEQHSNKRNNPYSGYLDSESALWLADPPFSKNFDEEFSNRSSLGSTISTSEASMRRGNGNGAEFPVHRLWDTPVPSKRRTTMFRCRASSEKVTRSLMAIDEPEVSSVSCPSNDALIVHNSSPLVGVEIGLGSVLLRQPLLVTHEPESEASSFLLDKKGCDIVKEFRRGSSGGLLSLVNSDQSFLPQVKEKGKNIPKRSEAGRLQSERNFVSNKALLENFPYNKHNVLQSCQSPLVFLEMKDIVNVDTFTGLLSCQEQAELMELLSPVDISNKTDSLKHMLSSSQFEAALSNFQQLLSEGMFDSTDARRSLPLLQHFQQLFVLTDLSTSGWMEQYLQLQRSTKRRGSAEKLPKFRDCIKEEPKDYNSAIAGIPPFTGPSEFESFPGRPPGRALNKEAFRSCTYPNPTFSGSAIKNMSMTKEIRGYAVKPNTIGNSSGDSNGCDVGSHPWTYYGSTSVSLSPQGHRLSGGFSSTVTGDEQDSNSDLDLLVNIPSNRSFQQAELLQYPSSGKGSYASLEADCDLGEAENGSLIMSNTWHMDSASAWDGLIWKNPCAGSESLLPNGTILNP
ncbi:hypothetical protein O6H91_06G109300 [Diphasiastrum complanatum]|uniref:Uncharacterized protein n=1 Tax=Diphasiastrum complanatum TaxID=34168 RepID=A0ACC2DHD9_DIPCM|nr:hypothetical protein O6H91_06G109300 [Diphasiastrum complanatum]